MLIQEIVPLRNSKSNNRLRVRLQDGADFILYKKEMNRFDLKEGEEISKELYTQLLTEIFIPRARQRALYLLEKQDRTESNLRQKLRDSGYPYQAIEEAITYVKSYNYINDERYTQNYIKYKSKTKSKKAIYNDLYNKGISKDIIERALEGLRREEDTDIFCERKIIEDYINKKLYKHEILDEKTKQKIYNSLLRKGFSSGEILSVMREVCIDFL